MNIRPQSLAMAMAMFLLLPGPAPAQSSSNSVVSSKHNLSASGLGTIKAVNEKQVCIFCHTPHHAAAVQPLWNRNMPVTAYRIYSSSSLVSVPGQPSGSSKLCLSCHDGTIALGSILSRTSTVQMAGGVTTLPPGATNLGTDLSGDHPISFTYDTNLVSLKPGSLLDPAALPPQVKLDSAKQLQCTTCHDPHDDSRGNFLVMDNSNSQLCNSCHIPSGQATIAGHSQCANCHQPHNSPSGALLLTQATVTDTCLVCHGSGIPAAAPAAMAGLIARPDVLGSGVAAPNTAAGALARTATNIAGDLKKLSGHKYDVPSPATAAVTVPRVSSEPKTTSVNCADCHEPHTIKHGAHTAPNLAPDMGKVSGITAAGALVAKASFEYQVCFKCHSADTRRPLITRNSVQTSIRRQFELGAVSFHPVVGAGRGHNVPSLVPGMTTASVIACTDCHNSDTGRKAGGGGPNGPHGSNNMPLLIANYVMVDGSSESSVAYELCYRCHQRTSILNNDSFAKHNLHLVTQRTPCVICHDSHGISSAQGTTTNNSHLINFDVSIVRPDPVTKRLEYQSQGPRQGACYLTCHGVAHSPKTYGPTAIQEQTSPLIRHPSPGPDRPAPHR